MQMDYVLDILVDECVHMVSPSQFAMSEDPAHWVPGAYSWYTEDTAGTRLFFMCLMPLPNGDLEGFCLSFVGEQITLFVPKGLVPHSCCALAVCRNKTSYDLTGLDQQIKALLGHLFYCAGNFPAS